MAPPSLIDQIRALEHLKPEQLAPEIDRISRLLIKGVR
jgi:hypothetical protein